MIKPANSKVPSEHDADHREHLKSMVEKVRSQQNSMKEARVFETWKKFKHK